MTVQDTVAQQINSGDLEAVAEFAAQLRVDSIRVSTHAGSGHPTSSLSLADVMAVLYARHLHYDFAAPKNPNNDHVIFSKGHASPLIYSLFHGVGAVSEEEFLTYRSFGSRLQGHPTPLLPWVDVATGSLGQGLPIAVGVALAGQEVEHLPYHVWVACGDSELAEGSVWEAFDKASHFGLSNLTVICDINRLGQRGPTELEWDIERYARRMEAFGMYTLAIDGHNLAEIDEAFTEVRNVKGRPSVILAKTIKGKGVPAIEDQNGWHGKTLPEPMATEAIEALGGIRHLLVPVLKPEAAAPKAEAASFASHELPTWEIGAEVATRKAFGESLKALGDNPSLVVLDAEVGNSTHTEDFGNAYPARFFQIYIAEQQMVSSAVGFAVRGFTPVAATFGAFVARAYDFVRMASVSQVGIHICGSHAGSEIGADGPSQMALEDIASLRAIHNSVVLYPSDAPSTAALVREMLDLHHQVVYIRTTRGAYPVIYGPKETFPIGGAKVLRSSDNDQVTLVGAGVTLHACLAAADALKEQHISARVIDLYSIKPIAADLLAQSVAETQNRVVVVEDHYPEGGIGEAVQTVLMGLQTKPAFAHLAVSALPTSGTPAELMDAAGITSPHIVAAALKLIQPTPTPH